MKLKVCCIVFLILLATAFDVKSQSREFIVGAMIGFYGIHIEGDVEELYSSSNGTFWGTGGLSAGLNVKRYFSKSIYGAFEIRYSKKGGLYEFISSYSTQAYESIKLQYIEFPLLFGVKANLKKRYLLLETGFSYARLINAKMQVSDFKRWDVSEKLDNFKENDLSWVANLKYPIIKNEKLLIGFRFTYSLMSIHNYYKLYNMDYGVELYYLFNRNVK